MEDVMLGTKMETLLAVEKYRNYTRAAQALSMTQPGITHHIKQLEEEVGAPLFIRGKDGMRITHEGEIVVKYAKRFQALNRKMHLELENIKTESINLHIGITHTAESNQTAEVLAKCCNQHGGLNITILTDTIKNLYDMLSNYEIDLAIVDGPVSCSEFSSIMLDTDYLVCVMSPTHPLSGRAAITLTELKKQQLILRLPTSATRSQFESALENRSESIHNFDITLEVDNIATIKDLIRKDLGVSILPRSACMDELRKGKIVALPVENLSMIRETHIIYNPDFSHTDILQEIIATYQREVTDAR